MAQRMFVLFLLLLASCQFLPVDDEPRPRPSRDRGADDEPGEEGEGEGEGEEGGEGEGEGELLPDLPAQAGGPQIVSFDLSATTLRDTDVAVATVVVTDPDGLADIVAPLLIEPVSGRTLGTLTQSAPGTFTASVTWQTFPADVPIEFVRGGTSRFLRVQFSDLAGLTTSSTKELRLVCDADLPACNSACGALRCTGEGNACVAVTDAVDEDEACSSCNIGCDVCTANCACFNDAPVCNGTDCVRQVDGDAEQQVCADVGGLTMGSDGFLRWTVDGVALPVLFGQRGFSLPNGYTEYTVGDALCAQLDGVAFVSNGPFPGPRTERVVVTVDNDCRAANLLGCEPVLRTNTQHLGTLVECRDRGPTIGGYGQACDVDGGCDFADGVPLPCVDNVCREQCTFNGHCNTCDDATGTACVCVDNICVAGGGPDTGGLNQLCEADETCDDDFLCSYNLGEQGCREPCSFHFECDRCASQTNGCNCVTRDSGGFLLDEGFCVVGRHEPNLQLCAPGERHLTSTGSFNGSASGVSAHRGSCGGTGPEQLWVFTAPSAGTYTFATTSGFDSVVYLREACNGDDLDIVCDDDGAPNGVHSRVSLAMTQGQRVVVFVDRASSAGGSAYTLSITRQ